MAYEPTVLRVAGGFPRVEILFSALPASVRSISVYRDGDPVRGGWRLPASQAVSVLDYEIPVDTSVTYTADLYNAAGTKVATAGGTSFVYHSDGLERVWIHNPLDPSIWVRATFQSESARNPRQTTNSTIHRPQGARVGIMAAGRRSGLLDTTFGIITHSVEDTDRLDEILGNRKRASFPVICMRTTKASRWRRLPATLFFGIEMTEAEVMRGISQGLTMISGEEVESPLVAVIRPLFTRGDLDAYYASRAAMDADNATRLDIDRRYDIARSANVS